VVAAQVGAQLVGPAQAQRGVGGHEVEVEGAGVELVRGEDGRGDHPSRLAASLAEKPYLPVALHVPVVGVAAVEEG
jgi:hypothetical protein